MNVAALGNMVPQLHIHVIARHTTDAAWPTPVWNAPGATPYTDPQPLLDQLRAQLKLDTARRTPRRDSPSTPAIVSTFSRRGPRARSNSAAA